MKTFTRRWLLLVLALLPLAFAELSLADKKKSEKKAADTPAEVAVVAETSLDSPSIIARSLSSGPVVFLVLMILLTFSIVCWGIVIAKWYYLRRIERYSKTFTKNFWDSRSLNELNGKLAEYPYSPVREIFRSGYAELVRGSQLRDQSTNFGLAVEAALDNLNRSLQKSKGIERRHLERFLIVLAISASACPFIGLFGTVWGIMSSFEEIARTGTSSLAAVAPGISEALIATAFGLAAAIPAVVGYNVAQNKIRGLMSSMDSFGADFLNIVQRYLIIDRNKTQGGSASPASMAQSGPAPIRS